MLLKAMKVFRVRQRKSGRKEVEKMSYRVIEQQLG
jgi:hypothetical protein